MDRSLKQRLTGATVLIILGVIFIPMLLDGPPTDGYQEIDVPIPDPLDREFETRLLPVNQTADERATPDNPDRPVPRRDDLGEVVETRLMPMNPDPAADTESSSTVRDPVPTVNSTTAADEVSQPPRTVDRPSETTPAVRDTAATAEAVPGLDRQGGWMLQAGTFGSQANATGLSERLTALGWAGSVTPISRDGGTLYQVSAGRFGSEQAADRATTRFATQFPDLKAVVRRVESDQATTTGPAVTETPTESSPQRDASELGSWMIQVASFGDEANAVTLRDQLRSSGYVAHVEHAGSGSPYRVRVGPLVNRSDAETTRDRIESAFELKGILVRHP